MTTIAEGQEILRKAIAEGKVKPVPSPPPTAYPIPSAEPAMNPLLRGPMPVNTVLTTDTVRQWHNSAIPQTRLPPLPPTSNAVAGAQSQPQAIVQVASTPPSGGGGITSVGLTAPNIHIVAGSPLSPPGGTIALGLASEIPNTVFAAPTSTAGNVAIDSLATTTGNFPGSGTGPYAA